MSRENECPRCGEDVRTIEECGSCGWGDGLAVRLEERLEAQRTNTEIVEEVWEKWQPWKFDGNEPLIGALLRLLEDERHENTDHRWARLYEEVDNALGAEEV